MSLPLLNLADAPPAELVAAFQSHGAILLQDPHLPEARCDAALAEAAAFFALPPAAKQALAIERSLHFRGYSELHNERDWREQIHFGAERPSLDGPGLHRRLQGPNLWPEDPGWRERMTAYLADVTEVGRRLLIRMAEALGAPLDPAASRWLGDDPYRLMKLIGYHPQAAEQPPRRGVAAHLDFSLLTLTLQDDVGGLEVLGPDGVWHPVPCRRGAWLVNIGELLAYVTGNRLTATPHRVVNPSTRRPRHSIPVFVNPSLDTILRPDLPPRPPPTPVPGTEHIHAVLDPAVPPPLLPFGPAEWQRKGENVWCRICCSQARPAPSAGTRLG